MFVKAVIAFLILPGIFGFLIPLFLYRLGYFSVPAVPQGLILSTSGLAMLLLCIKDFYSVGKGTLAPWSPPKHFVCVGLYKFTRNPMYISVILIVAGAGFWLGSLLILFYSILLSVGFHIRVIKFEEPRLASKYGDAYKQYLETVNRWLPKLP